MVGNAPGGAAVEGKSLIRGDTIVAIATPPGRGGIGIVRISGPGAITAAQAVTRQVRLPLRRPMLGAFHDRDNMRIDQGLVFAFAAPNSFTGEEVVELHAHGSPVVLDMIVEAVLKAGVRLAEPGEFSLRAFLNNKIDLAQAEAIADLIDAGSRTEARAAAGSLAGELSRRVQDIRQALLDIRVIVEASIDFPDEDLDLLSEYGLRERVDEQRRALNAMREEAAQGVNLRRHPKIVIAGMPNTGKSSLLNRMTGRDSAIVTAIPGTTRDVVREQFDLQGMRMELVDTAGLRTTDDVIEVEGIRRARAEVEQADLVLYVVDGSRESERDPTVILATAELGDLQAQGRVLVLVNKVDRTGEPLDDGDNGLIRISALTGDGLGTLMTRVQQHMGLSDMTPRFLARRRHLDAMDRTAQALLVASGFLVNAASLELAAEELKGAQQHLGDIVGDVSSDELLGHIFSSFCIGK